MDVPASILDTLVPHGLYVTMQSLTHAVCEACDGRHSNRRPYSIICPSSSQSTGLECAHCNYQFIHPQYLIPECVGAGCPARILFKGRGADRRTGGSGLLVLSQPARVAKRHDISGLPLKESLVQTYEQEKHRSVPQAVHTLEFAVCLPLVPTAFPPQRSKKL